MTPYDGAAGILASLELSSAPRLDGRRAAFLGCGDSLAAARPSEELGHRVLSAGDTAWSGVAPRGVDVAVALSWSGKTGATIRAAQVVLDAGMPLISITSNPESPLALMSDSHVTAPSFEFTEDIPGIGFAVHTTTIRNMVGESDAATGLADLAHLWADAGGVARELVEASGVERPDGITVASMPEVRGAAEFWSLKIIEATGISVRTAPIEEVGHVDYFVGPQPHVTFMITGGGDTARALSLGAALARNGQTVVSVPLGLLYPSLGSWDRETAGGLLGTLVADGVAAAWGRDHFRGGAVDMSARHIQVG